MIIFLPILLHLEVDIVEMTWIPYLPNFFVSLFSALKFRLISDSVFKDLQVPNLP